MNEERKMSNYGPSNKNIIRIVVVCAVAIMLVVGISAGVYYGITGKVPQNPLSVAAPSQNQLTQYATQTNSKYPLSGAPGYILLTDQFGAVITSATLKLYTPGSYASTVATVTTDGTTGIATMPAEFTSGTTYTVDVIKAASNIDFWTTWTVPDGISLTSTSFYSVLKAYTLGTFTLAVQDQAGNSYANNGNWNKTAPNASNSAAQYPGMSVSTYSVTIHNTAANTGFVTSTNPIYNVQYGMVLQVAISGTGYDTVAVTAPASVMVNGVSTPVASAWLGTTRYWWIPVDPSTLTYTVVGGSPSGGVTATSITLDLSGYTGTSATIATSLYVNTNAQYRAAQGSFGTFSYNPSVSNTLTLTH